MKRSFVIVFSLLITIIIFSGCGNTAKESDFARIDSIVLIVDKAENKLHEVNLDTLQEKYNLYKQYSEKIEKDFYDIKNDESWPYICSYRNCKKSFKEMTANYKIFQAEIDSSHTQLNNLKHDLRRNVLSSTEVDQFCLLEKQNAKVLLEKITFRVNNAIKEELNFDTVHPYIVKLITDLESGKIKANSIK